MGGAVTPRVWWVQQGTFIMKPIFTCLLTFSLTFGFSYSAQCGYQSCPATKPDKLNVHIISHTHDDVGWLKTYDQYYYGSETNLARAGVQYILDSVIEELQLNPERRFIYVETAFFWRWFKLLDEDKRQNVIKLVESGQLEFIGGGWTMNDEAAAHYHDIIDQMTIGLRTLRGLFKECGVPKVAWQIDPFGHSRQQASLFAQMGFDGLFVGRIDYGDKDTRLKWQHMEFVWNSSYNLKGPGSQLFTGALFNTYSPPPGFCFDLLCSDDPIIDDKSIPDYNVDERISEFYKYVMKQAKYYHTNNIAITMGNDFNYQYAGSWFKNLDKLIKYVNVYDNDENDTKVNAFYSTPSCYLKALHDANTSWPVKEDDFFPYASDPHAYWTGYFSSRPALKGNLRRTNNLLQVCKQLDAFTCFSASRKTSDADVDYLRRAQGVVQHHDAVTGTAKQAVTDDYARLLAEGVQHCEEVIDDAYKVINSKSDETPPHQLFCNKLNVSECQVTEENKQFVVTIYNPIGRPISHPVRIPVSGISYFVADSYGQEVIRQLVPIPLDVLVLPERNSTATHELVFIAQLPALGYATYFVKETKEFVPTQHSKIREIKYGNSAEISNEFYHLEFDSNTGFLSHVTNLATKVSKPVVQNFYWYRAMNGNNTGFKNRASGAYIFRPNGTSPNEMSPGASITVVTGDVVQEVHQTFNDWVSQVVRLYKNSSHVEFEWIVGPIPFQDWVGKEIIMRFDTSLKTEGSVFTDTNGREMLRRIRNSRPSWHLNVTEPVSGNYYPIVNQVYIKDMISGDAQLGIITDRAVGGGSIHDGSIEIMIHRRLLHDDAFGVSEPLNETGFDGNGLRVRGKTLMMLNIPKDAAPIQREAAQRMSLAPLISFAVTSMTSQQWQSKFSAQFSGLKRPLPANVQLLTLETLASSYVLIRLEHFYEKFDDPQNLSLPATVDLKELFTSFTIVSLEETMLAADRLQPAGNFNWKLDDNNIPDFRKNKEIPVTKNLITEPTTIVLNPMQIRTFLAKIKYLN